jgi:hypothetical protein
MKDGSVAEFDQPHILLSKSDSILRSMVAQTGANAPILLQLAKESHDEKQTAVGVRAVIEIKTEHVLNGDFLPSVDDVEIKI